MITLRARPSSRLNDAGRSPTARRELTCLPAIPSAVAEGHSEELHNHVEHPTGAESGAEAR